MHAFYSILQQRKERKHPTYVLLDTDRRERNAERTHSTSPGVSSGLKYVASRSSGTTRPREKYPGRHASIAQIVATIESGGPNDFSQNGWPALNIAKVRSSQWGLLMSQTYLGWHKNVRHVLVLAEQRKVQEDLQRLRVGSHDDELGDTAVQRLGGCGV